MEPAILEREALNLPEAQRAVLIERLIQSLTEFGDDRSDRWLKESTARHGASKDGLIGALDGDSFVAQLRSDLANK